MQVNQSGKKSLSVFAWIKRLLHVLVNLLLLLILVVQVTVYLNFFKNSTLSVPDYAKHFIQHWCDSEGFRFDYEKSTFDFSGQIVLENISFGLKEFEEPVFTAEHVFLRLNIIYLLFGNVDIEALNVSDATVWTVPIYSERARHETMVSGIVVEYSNDHENPRLSARAKFNNTELYLKGEVSEDFLDYLEEREDAADAKMTEDREKPSSRQAFTRNYRKVISYAEEVKNYEKHFQGSSILLEFHPLSDSQLKLSGEILVSDATVANVLGEDHFSMDAVQASFSVLYPFETDTKADFSLRTQRFGWDGKGTVTELALGGKLSLEGMPEHVSVYAERVLLDEWAQYPVSDLYATLDFLSEKTIDADVLLNVLGGSLRIGGMVDLLKKNADVYVESLVNPAIVLNDPIVPEYIRVELLPLKLPNAPEISGNILIADDWQFDRAKLFVKIEGGSFHEINANYVSAKADISLSELLIHDFYGITKDYEARGSFYQNFENNDYRFLLSGSIRPNHLDAILGDWWINVWKDISLTGKLPNAVVDVIGRWHDFSKQYVRVYAEGEEVTYRKLHADNANLIVMYRPGLLRLIDVNITRSEGDSSGNINWFFDKDHGSYAIQLAMRGTIMPHATYGFLPQNVRDIINNLEYEKAPNLKLNAVFYDPWTGYQDYDDIRVQVNMGHPFTYRGLPIDSGEGLIHIIRDDVDISPLSLGLASGMFTGKALYKGNPVSEATLSVQGSLKQADAEKLARLIEAAAALDDETEKTPDEKHEQQTAGTKPDTAKQNLPFSGAIDIDVDASGPFFDFNRFEGKGKNLLTSKNLTTIHTLGFLSRMMEKTMLPSGTMTFTRLESSYTLKNGVISSDDIKITGEYAKIISKGQYDTVRDALAFRGSIELFGATQSMVGSAVNFVTSIFTSALSFEIYGNLKDPQWIFSNDPRWLFYDPKK